MEGMGRGYAEGVGRAAGMRGSLLPTCRLRRMGRTERTRGDEGSRRRGRGLVRGGLVLCVYLCGGVVLTWVAAWGFAWRGASGGSRSAVWAMTNGEPPARFFLIEVATGATSVVCLQEMSAAADIDQARETGEFAPVPWFARHLGPAQSAPEPPATTSVTAFGWPWRAVSFEGRQIDVVDEAGDGATGRFLEARGAMVIPRTRRAEHSIFESTELLLPLLPLWRGLIANSLFYALSVWLLRRGFVAASGWRRRRRGRCGWRGGCGYDLRGSVVDVCPECGRPVGEGRQPRSSRSDAEGGRKGRSATDGHR